MSILVMGGAHTTDIYKFRHLHNSAARLGVELCILGYGKTFDPWPSIQNCIDFAKSRTEPYILLTDTFDVLMSRWNEQELRMMMDAAPDLIISVEWWVYPKGPWASAYAALEGRYRWYAINGGQYCGRREQMIAMWEAMLWRARQGQETAGGSSQELLHKMYLDGAAFTLDLECRIFQSMFGPHAPLIVSKDGRAFNTITGSYPMFLHFNGGAPGIEEWSKVLATPPPQVVGVGASG